MGRPFKYEWNEKRINAMIKYYSIGDYESLFEELGFDDMDIIRHKAMDLCLKSDYYNFSEVQLQFIRDNYLNMSYGEIGVAIGKTKSSISTKVHKMGLIKFNRWTDEDFETLKEKYPHYSNKYLSEKIFLGKKPHSIRTMALKMGLHKTEEKGLKFYDKDEMIERLANLGKELGRTPSLEELSVYGLPSSASYQRYFGGYRQACLLANLEINESLYGRAKIYISTAGDVCYSNSERVITEFFIKNNIDYTKDNLYNSICNDVRCGTKRTDWIINEECVVEYWGYPKIDSYQIGKNIKTSICRDNNIKLIELSRKDIAKLHTIFSMFL